MSFWSEIFKYFTPEYAETIGNAVNAAWNRYKGYNQESGSSADIGAEGMTPEQASMSRATGEWLNNVTGVTASQDWQSDEALKSRDHATAERLGSQEFNAEQAQLSRDFQEYYDSTAMQRRVADMQAAGLNPMMLAHGMGASLGTASGSTAATSSPGGSANASGAGNSASALSGIVRAITGLIKSVT